MSEASDHEFLTTGEVAAYLRVSQHTIWRWCQEGHLPAFQIGRVWRIRKDELEELVKGSKPERAEPVTSVSAISTEEVRNPRSLH